ncbi:MAG: diacylglycerol kinase family lipid kinase [Anaerolineae bacterium]|nr:diacylglycerol kinase family lipid kinase [Anaerolineae bacterium]
MTAKRPRICVIVNPVSGVQRTALDDITNYFAAQQTHEYEICVTERGGDARRFAQQAVARQVDVVAAYGGDGTMMEVAEGLRESSVPMAFLPGGTANVMAIELGIPTDLSAALDLALNPTHQVRVIDIGCVDNQYFLLRSGLGYEAEFSAGAARGAKSKSGRLAYVMNAIRKLRDMRPVRYVITIDGEIHVQRGITCMICNSTSIGVPNLRLVSASDVSDGLLDVIVIHNVRPGTIIGLVIDILRGILPGAKSRGTQNTHWQGREVTVTMNRRQLVARDGEPLKRAKRISAHIVPQALRVIVPATTLETSVEHLDRDQAAV